MAKIYDGLRDLISDQESKINELPLGEERSEAIKDYVSLMDKSIQHDKLDEDVLDRRTKMEMDDTFEREKLQKTVELEDRRIIADIKKKAAEHKNGLITTGIVAAIALGGTISENFGMIKFKANEVLNRLPK